MMDTVEDDLLALWILKAHSNTNTQMILSFLWLYTDETYSRSYTQGQNQIAFVKPHEAKREKIEKEKVEASDRLLTHSASST